MAASDPAAVVSLIVVLFVHALPHVVQFIVHDLDGVTDDFFLVVCDCHWLSFLIRW